MIVIRVLFRLRPEAAGGFAALMQPDLELARRLPGCLRFALFADPHEPDAWLLYEEWESLAAFEAYKQSEAFDSNGAKIFPLLAGKPDSAYFEASPIPLR